METKQPEYKVSAGNVQGTAWLNDVTSGDGRTFKKRSFKVEKSYKDKDGNWKTTTNFDIQELQKLSVVKRELERFHFLNPPNA